MSGQLGTDEQQDAAGGKDRPGSEAVGEPTDDGREGIHADDVERDDEPDDLEVLVPVPHVQGRHGHDADHDDVASHHAEDGKAPGRRAGEHADRGPEALACLCRKPHTAGEGQGIRNQALPDEKCRSAEQDDAKQVGTDQGWKADQVGGPGCRTEANCGAEHGAEGRRPDEAADRLRPTFVVGQVGGGVPGGEIRGIAGADPEDSQYQQGIPPE